MEKKSISIDNKIISYGIEGNGMPVVFLHGFGEDGTVWDNQVAYFRDFYKIIIPDIPGSGVSELTNDVSMEGIAEVVKLIVEAEELESIVLIGHSMGSYATLAFAEKYPHLLDGFGLFHGTAAADSAEKIATRKKGIAFIEKNGAAAFIESTTANLFAEETKKNKPELMQQFLKGLPEFSKAALIAYYEAMIARLDRTELLPAVDIPVLFIIGEQDNVISFEDALKQASMPRRSYINILHHSGHLGMLEEPKKANDAIEEFLIDLK